MESLRASLKVFSHRSFAVFWLGRVLSILATVVQTVTTGWQVYSVARQTHSIEQSSFLLGMVGLVQFLPMFLLVLTAGEVADRYDRRKVLLIASALEFACVIGLAFVSMADRPSLALIFAIAALIGVANAFIMPVVTAIAPMLVPKEILPRAIAWNVLSRMVSTVLGPWLGGILCASSVPLSYSASASLCALSITTFFLIRGDTKPKHDGGSRLVLIREGLAYVWSNKLVFGAISLDLFAVLLGSVTSLLPAYARDILDIGPGGFGLLRSGAAIGGGVMSVVLAVRPFHHRAGLWMFGSVFVFGAATIVFALSRDLTLSMLMLIVLGGADVISVYVRQSLVQIVTPDNMRGRVSAVSGLFISASNNLGEFESGVAARFLGPVGSALFGGIGSIMVTLLWARLFPALRKADRLVPDA